MDKKIKAIIIFVLSCFILIGGFFLFPALSNAQYTYTPLEPIPGFSGATDFPAFIIALYKFGIWTVGIAALLMITIGGFMYLTSAGNTSKMDSAKGVITDALIGLIIALAAYLILYIINPDLVKVQISFSPISSNGGSSITNPEATSNPNTTSDSSVGCGKVVEAAVLKKNSGCTYSQPRRNGCMGNPAYTDCSDLVSTSYLKAGCSSPGNTTAAIYPKAKTITNKNSLKAGDLIVRPGHVVMCENDGCSRIIHASGEKKGLVERDSTYYLNPNWGGKVVSVSDYCKSC